MIGAFTYTARKFGLAAFHAARTLTVSLACRCVRVTPFQSEPQLPHAPAGRISVRLTSRTVSKCTIFT